MPNLTLAELKEVRRLAALLLAAIDEKIASEEAAYAAVDAYRDSLEAAWYAAAARGDRAEMADLGEAMA